MNKNVINTKNNNIINTKLKVVDKVNINSNNKTSAKSNSIDKQENLNINMEIGFSKSAEDIFGEYENYVIAKDDLKEGKLLEKFKYIENNEQKIKKILKEKMPNYIEQSKSESLEHILAICRLAPLLEDCISVSRITLHM